MSSERICAACSREIDALARLCPYCGADPATGERQDTQALLQEVFRPREMSASESVFEYARQRQGVFIAALHQFVTARNNSAVTDAPAVPLSEITDVTKRAEETVPVAMPKLDFQYDGQPKAMRTFIVESGATTPPEIVAAQQLAAQEKAAQQQPAQPAASPQTGVRPVPAQPVRPAPATATRPPAR